MDRRNQFIKREENYAINSTNFVDCVRYWVHCTDSLRLETYLPENGEELCLCRAVKSGAVGITGVSLCFVFSSPVFPDLTFHLG